MTTRRQLLFLVSGLALFIAGGLALLSIPRGLLEFTYGVFAPGYQTLAPLPFAPMNGFTPQQLSSHLARLVFFTPASVLLGLAVGGWMSRRRLPPIKGRLVALLGALAVLLAGALLFRGTPTSDDEATYLMQAGQLLEGRVFDPTLSKPVYFWEPFTIFREAGATGKYLFGTPLMIAPGLALGVPLLGHVLLVFLTLMAVFAAAQREEGHTLALVGTALLAVSPSFLYTSATPLSQTPGLAGLAVAVWAVSRGGWAGGLAAGTGLGLALAARPQMAVPAGLVFLTVYAWRDRRLLVGAALAGLPWLLAILAFNKHVTGSPFSLPWDLYSIEKYGFGFPFAQRVYEHTPLKGLLLTGVALLRLNGWGLGWPVSWVGPVLWLVLGRPARRAVSPWAWITLATFLFQIPYYSVGVSETGALYHYSALPFIALSTAAVLVHLAGTRWREAALGTAAASLVVGTLTFHVEHAARLNRLLRLVEGPVPELEAHLDRPTLVFLPDVRSRPPVGWTFGSPFRERRESAQVVYYPYSMDPAVVDYVTQLWEGRQCLSVFFDYPRGRYEVTDCAQMKTKENEVRGWMRASATSAPWRRDGMLPWWANGGWKAAFPWVPGLGEPGPSTTFIAPPATEEDEGAAPGALPQAGP